VYLKDDRGTVRRETDPDEIERLVMDSAFKVISVEEGEKAFAEANAVPTEAEVEGDGRMTEVDEVKEETQ
jgi:hypothetical protein